MESEESPPLKPNKHEADCGCDGCIAWYKMGFTGRCSRCGRPVDEHLLGEKGEMFSCPVNGKSW